jgi:hypothetical protein
MVSNANQGWGQKLMGSIKGILLGLILFIGSFVVIFINEGRVDVSNIASTATEINSTESNTELDGQLITTTGNLVTTAKLGDTYLQEGNYISLRRIEEMYAWEEESDHDSDTDSTTYSYNKVWTSSPEDSDHFRDKSYENPKKSVENVSLNVGKARIGNYEIDIPSVSLPAHTEVRLDSENTIVGGRLLDEDEDEEYYENFEDIPGTVEDGKYIFRGFGTYGEPEIGDIRISYTAYEAGNEVSIFGKLNGNKISPYIGDKNTKLYRIFEGTADEGRVQMHNEYTGSKWMLRILGFVLMWLGLGLVLGPISATLDFVPVVGSLSRSVIGLVTFIVAGILSTIAIWISMILQNIWALLVVILVAGGSIYAYINMQAGKAPKSGPGSPGPTNDDQGPPKSPFTTED